MLQRLLAASIVLIAVVAIHFYTLRVPHVNNETGEEIDFEVEAEKYLSGDTKRESHSVLAGLCSKTLCISAFS